MNKVLVSTVFITTSLFLNSCSINSNSETTNPKKKETADIYKIIAVSKTMRGKGAIPCTDAVGTIAIHNGQINGTATDSIQRQFTVSGKVTSN